MQERSYTKDELERIRKANELRRFVNFRPHQFKLAYIAGGNLVLLKKKKGKWLVYDETGAWFNPVRDYMSIQWQGGQMDYDLRSRIHEAYELILEKEGKKSKTSLRNIREILEIVALAMADDKEFYETIMDYGYSLLEQDLRIKIRF